MADIYIATTPQGQPFAVFSTEEKARRYADSQSQPGAVCKVEEWTIDAEDEPAAPAPLETRAPDICPECGDVLTWRTEAADGQPSYCDTCDREVL